MRRAILAPVNASRLALTLCLCAVLMPSQASGQNDGVVVDPGSPTGKEYAIPLESARRQAEPRGPTPGGPAGVRQGSRSAPLFGEGIVAGNSKAGGKTRGGSGPESDADGTGGANAPAAIRPAVENPGAPSGGVGTTLLASGGWAAILLVGGLAGYLFRRRSRA